MAGGSAGEREVFFTGEFSSLDTPSFKLQWGTVIREAESVTRCNSLLECRYSPSPCLVNARLDIPLRTERNKKLDLNYSSRVP